MPHDPRRRVVLYEYTCSGGLLGKDTSKAATSLMREGWAMLRSVASDLASLPSTHIQILADHRGLPGTLPGCELIPVGGCDQEIEQLSRLAKQAEWTIIIAPEFDRILLDRCRAVEECGGRLLGPNAALVELLSDKQRTIEHLQRHGVGSPEGWLWRPGDAMPGTLPCPAVIKPNDGAGAQDTYVCRDMSRVGDVMQSYERTARIEPHLVGAPASVSFLCGPAGCFPLLPCRQRLLIDHRISYLGGSLPLSEMEQQRAISMAKRAVESLPNPLGYLGVDLILGEDASGAADCVVEINPRLTTSYVGLRVAARTSLAQAMLDAAEGRPPHLSFDSRFIEFDADGTVRRC